MGNASLTIGEQSLICKTLYDLEFGKPAERKKAVAILGRLNEHILVEKTQNKLEPMNVGCHVEHVQPQQHEDVRDWNDTWDSTDASTWKNKLGNLALLNRNTNSKIGNGSFERKKDHLIDSPYPLTKEIAKTKAWDVHAVKQNHDKTIGLAKEVWNLVCLENESRDHI